jgi:hypothetical protein
MVKAIRGHNLGATVTLAFLAALLLLAAAAFAVQQAVTSSVGVDRAAVSADRAGGSSYAPDPYLDRHAEVVGRYRDSAATRAWGEVHGGGSSLDHNPAIESHAEIVNDSIR